MCISDKILSLLCEAITANIVMSYLPGLAVFQTTSSSKHTNTKLSINVQFLSGFAQNCVQNHRFIVLIGSYTYAFLFACLHKALI